MENHGILNWRKWPRAVKKGAYVGGLTAIILTLCAYALNHWVRSIPPGNGEVIGLIIGMPSIAPLYPLALVLTFFDVRHTLGQSGEVWLHYCVAGLLNAVLLTGLGALIGFVWYLSKKKQE
jgi:hypothetical protein